MSEFQLTGITKMVSKSGMVKPIESRINILIASYLNRGLWK